MGQFSRNLMVIAFLERTYCVPSSAMCAGHTSLNIELQGESAADGIAGNMKGVTEMKEHEWSILSKSIGAEVDFRRCSRERSTKFDVVSRTLFIAVRGVPQRSLVCCGCLWNIIIFVEPVTALLLRRFTGDGLTKAIATEAV